MTQWWLAFLAKLIIPAAGPCAFVASNTLKTGRTALFAFALVWLPPTAATANPDVKIEAFINAPGFVPVEVDYFWSEDWHGAHRFPHYDRERWILHADSELGDADKAILAIDAIDRPLTHVRYKATTTFVPDLEEWQQPFRFLEVTRYNLGPTLFESIRQAYEGVFTPSDADVERAPHVTWRFVFVTSKFQGADPVAISRKQLTDAEAMAHMCFALSCMDLADPLGDQWPWNELAVDEGRYPAGYVDIADNGLTVPARIANLLMTEGDILSEYEMVISANIAGQDDVANGIVRYNIAYTDTDISDWLVRRQIAGVPPFWGQIRTGLMPGEPAWNMPYGFDPGPIEWTHVPTDGLDTWRMTIEFEVGASAPARYEVVLNRDVATYVSDHWMYLSIADFPGLVYARDPKGGIALPLLAPNADPQHRVELARLPNRFTATGRTVPFLGYLAHEFDFIASLPDVASSVYPAWTGTFWAVRELPSASGWYGLPGSPFAGRSPQFSSFWQALGWDIENCGLIVRAEITLRDGLTESDIAPMLSGVADISELDGKGWGQETIRMRVTDLRADDTGTLSFTFPDLARIGRNPWPHALPPQTVGILERY